MDRPPGQQLFDRPSERDARAAKKISVAGAAVFTAADNRPGGGFPAGRGQFGAASAVRSGPASAPEGAGTSSSAAAVWVNAV